MAINERTLAARAPRIRTHTGIWLVACLYAVIAVDFARFHAFWCPDSGARFWTVQSLARRGTVDVGYAFLSADPDRRFHPLAGYTVRLPHATVTTFHGFFPLITVPFYRAFGWFGLAILPLLAGVATVVVTSALIRKAGITSHPAVPWVVALATPLPLYAAVFWDHSLQFLVVALAASAMLKAWREESRRAALCAGLLFGGGAWIHETVLLCGLAVLLAAFPLWRMARGRRLMVAGVAGAVPPLLALLCTNRLVYGMALGPHIQNVNDPRQPGFLSTAFSPNMSVYRLMFQIAGAPEYSPLAWGLAGCVAVYVGACLLGLRSAPLRRSCWALAAITACVLVTVVPQANGLFEATPLFLLALLAFEGDDAKGATPSIGVAAWCARASVLFLVLIFCTGIAPGMDWGSRYLLTALPLLLVATFGAARRLWSSPTERAIIALLLVTSLYGQFRGWLAVRNDLALSGDIARAVAARPEQAVITDTWWLGAECAGEAVHNRLLWVAHPATDLLTAVQPLRRAHVQSVCLMGSPALAASLADAGLAATGSSSNVRGLAICPCRVR